MRVRVRPGERVFPFRSPGVGTGERSIGGGGDGPSIGVSLDEALLLEALERIDDLPDFSEESARQAISIAHAALTPPEAGKEQHP